MSAANTVVETADGWILPLAGREVTRCLVDFAFTLQFWVTRDDLAQITIGDAFEIATATRRIHLKPQPPTELGPALGLHQRVVQHAFAARDGSLEVTFTDGTVLRVLANPSYEAWDAHFKDGAMLVSQPGGRVAYWSARPSASPPSSPPASPTSHRLRMRRKLRLVWRWLIGRIIDYFTPRSS